MEILNTDNIGSFEILKRIWLKLSAKRKIQVFVALMVVILTAISELFLIATVIPFISSLSAQDEIYENNSLIGNLIGSIPFMENYNVVFVSTLTLILGVMIASILRIVNLYLNTKLAASIGSDLSTLCFKNILYRTYEEHISKNSGDLIASITFHIQKTVEAIFQGLIMATTSFIAITLLIGIFWLDIYISMTILLIFVFLYISLAYKTKRTLFFNSEKVSSKNKELLKIVQDGLGGIREIILDNNYDYFLKKYSKVDYVMRQSEANNIYLYSFPRYAFEGIGVGLLIFSGYFLSLSNNNSLSTLPILGTFALAFQRLLPTVQQFYGAFSGIRSNAFSIKNVLEMLEQNPNYSLFTEKNFRNDICFLKKLQLKNVSFCYEDDRLILNDTSIEINAGQIIGIIGKSGVGKSTLVDLILGLITPSSGSLIIDNEKIDYKNFNTLSRWRKLISHVPQNIYLTDATLAENIAFGTKYKDIDFRRLKHAIKFAQLEGFVKNTKKGLRSKVDELGMNLSGGQRQRIGIARALYKDIKLLILDEATNALDFKTEQKIIESIMEIGRGITIILISHNHDNLIKCDRIFEIESGKIIEKKIKK